MYEMWYIRAHEMLYICCTFLTCLTKFTYMLNVHVAHFIAFSSPQLLSYAWMAGDENAC